MDPHEITSDIARMVRFAATLAALGEDVHGLVDALLEQDGVRLVAWMSPGEIYNPELRELRKPDAPDAGTVGSYRQRLSATLHALMEVASSATGKDLGRVRAHVQMAAGISDREMARLLAGRDHLAVVGPVCDALHVEYRDSWVLVDPERLAARIDHSIWATAGAGQLRAMTTDQLRRLIPKLPSPPSGGAVPARPEEYRAPRPRHRYRALYEALAQDHRDVVRLTLADVDRLLQEASEESLPDTARTNRGWWVRSNSASAAQPQTAAWAAAGYQVREVQTRRARQGGAVIEAVELSSLPGRADWLIDEARTETGVFRLPNPGLVHIDLDGCDELPGLEVLREPSTGPETTTRSGFDKHVTWLQGFLHESGEADRAAIDKAIWKDHRPDATDQWIANLLTRARRNGRIKNHGTKSRPRWVTAESKGDLMLFIASQLGFSSDAPPVEPGTEVPVEFVRMVADRLGVAPPVDGNSETIARVVIERAGRTWTNTDHLITLQGPVWLRSMRDAVVNRAPGLGPAVAPQ
jgi:hypothetical protein